MSALLGFMRKEMHHILRDQRTLIILLVLPLAQVLLFGFAVRTDVREIALVAVDPTPDAATLELQARFRGTDLFTLTDVVAGTDALPRLFQEGVIDQALVFPTGFASKLGGTEPVELQVITDAADPNTGSTMQAYASTVIQRWQAERGVGAPVRITPDVRMYFNPTLESVNLFVPGLIAILLTVVSALMSAISLSREKERGTLEILLVSPLKPWQIIVGKVLPYMVLGFFNVASILVAAWLVFQVPFRGSLTLLLFESLLYVLVSLALGVLVAAITTSQRTAMVGALMGLLLPTLLLSGMIFPLSSMPAWLAWVGNLIPGKWFLLAARGIMLKGVGLEFLWRETLVLTGMTAALMVAAVRAFDVRLS